MSPMRILSFIHAYALWLYAIGVLATLLCLRELGQARKRAAETIFSLERELAGVREGRARIALVVTLALLALLTYFEISIVPEQPLPPLQEPTPTRFIIEAPTAIPVAPTPTVTRIPTRPRPTGEPPTETPTLTLAPPPCSNSSICMTYPTDSQVISGTVTIQGTATVENMQFYKIEYGLGESPEQWHSIGEMHPTAVVDGVLGVWDTTGFPAGVFTLRMTVVDITGNYPPPHDVRVTIQQ